MPEILVADDDAGISHALKLVLEDAGYGVEVAQSPKACFDHVASRPVDAVLLDLNFQLDTTSGVEGLDLLAKIRRHDETLPVIVLTAWASIELAVEAMRAGAGDFLQKPWENHRLLSTLETQLTLARAQRQSERLRSENYYLRRDRSRLEPNGLVAESQAMKQVLAALERLAGSSIPVMLTGENGTGKSALAEYVHQRSALSDGPLVSVNMGAITDGLFESEMFGHTRGAFTDARESRAGRFELAEGGTLFLDEVANIPLTQQGKLLRVLESGEYERLGSSQTRRASARLISATNADLEQAVVAGTFRQDLLYRLRGVEVRLPPLRERQADVLPLAERFRREFSRKYQCQREPIGEAAAAALRDYPWPGNVRELRSMIERAVVMSSNGEIDLEALGLAAAGTTPAASGEGETLPSLAEIERSAMLSRIEHFQGNMSATAKSLGLSRSTFYRRLGKHKDGA